MIHNKQYMKSSINCDVKILENFVENVYVYVEENNIAAKNIDSQDNFFEEMYPSLQYVNGKFIWEKGGISWTFIDNTLKGEVKNQVYIRHMSIKNLVGEIKIDGHIKINKLTINTQKLCVEKDLYIKDIYNIQQLNFKGVIKGNDIKITGNKIYMSENSRLIISRLHLVNVDFHNKTKIMLPDTEVILKNSRLFNEINGNMSVKKFICEDDNILKTSCIENNGNMIIENTGYWNKINLKNAGFLKVYYSSSENVWFIKAGYMVNTGTIILEGDGIIQSKYMEARYMQNENKLRNKNKIIIESEELENNSIIKSDCSFEITSNKFINNGIYDTPGNIILNVKNFNNIGGKIKAKQETNIKTISFNNYNGIIDESSKICINCIKLENEYSLGNILSNKIFIEVTDGLNLKSGKLESSESIVFKTAIISLTGLEINTPQLLLNIENFRMDLQSYPERTIVRISPGMVFNLTNEYKTPGTLEIREYGITNLEQAKKNWKKRFGNKSKIVEPEYNINIQASIYAEMGMKIYAPSALLIIGDNNKEMIEMIFEKSSFDAYISKLDIQKAIFVADSCKIKAGVGIKLGQLIRDPNKDAIATFYIDTRIKNNCDIKRCRYNSGYSIGRYMDSHKYEFMDETIKNVWDNKHLLVMPWAMGNGTNISIKKTAKFHGNITQYSDFSTFDLILYSNKESIFTASSTIVENNFYLKGTGNIRLNRCLGKHNFTCYTSLYANPHLIKHNVNHTYINSEYAEISIYGELYKDENITIYNEASRFYTHKTDCNFSIESINLVSSLFQKTYTKKEQNDLGLHINSIKYGGFYPHHFSPGNERQKLVQFLYFGINGATGYAQSFLSRTDGFVDAEQIFMANNSWASGVLIKANKSSIQGNITTPLMLIRVGEGGLSIGSKNNHIINLPPSFINVSNGIMNGFTIHISKDMKQKISKDIKKRFFFKIKERFFYDSQQSQKFYLDIYDHVVIYTEPFFKKIDKQALFSLSPQLLLNKIRKIIQNQLNRGYIKDFTKIDFFYLKQLHRNTTTYLQKNNLFEVKNIQSLINLKKLDTYSLIEPIIFYYEEINEEGIVELTPNLLFPQKMIEEAHGRSGSILKTSLMLTIPDNNTPKEMMESLSVAPVLENRVVKMLNKYYATHSLSPIFKNFLNSRQKYTVYPPTTSRPSLGSITLHGQYNIDQAYIISGGNINFHGKLEGHIACLVSLLGNIEVSSLVERVYKSGGNFYDHIPHSAKIMVNEIVYLLAGNNLLLKGFESISKQGSYFHAVGNVYDLVQVLVSQRISYDDDNIERITNVTNYGSKHISESDVTYISDTDNVTIQASQINSPNISIKAKQNIYLPEVHNTSYTYKNNTSKGGFFGGKTHTEEQTFISTSIGSKLKTDNLKISSEQSSVILQNMNLKSHSGKTPKIKIIAEKDKVHFLLGNNNYFKSSSSSNSNIFWNKICKEIEIHNTFSTPIIEGDIEIIALQTIVQAIRNQSDRFLEQINLNGGNHVVLDLVQDYYCHNSQKIQGPSVGLCALIMLSISTITLGTGSGLALATQLKLAESAAAVGMCSTAISTLSTQISIGLLNNNGDVIKALKTLYNEKFIRSFICSVASAGLTKGICQELKIAKPNVETFSQMSLKQAFISHFHYNLINFTVSTPINIAINQQNIKDILLSGLKEVIVDTVSGYLANQIGESYKNGNIDYINHKFYHACLGGSIGALITNDSVSGFIAGAMGAVSAEIIAEIITPDALSITEKISKKAKSQGIKLTLQEFNELYQDELRKSAYCSKIGAGFLNLLAHQNVDIGLRTATNSIENNFLVAAYYGAIAISIAYSGYSIINTLKTHGFEAALKELGVELGITLITYGSGRIAQKVIYYYAAKPYQHIKEAVHIALKSKTGLEFILGKVVNKLIVTGEKLSNTVMGQKIAKLENNILKMEAKFTDLFNKNIKLRSNFIKQPSLYNRRLLYANENYSFIPKTYTQKDIWDSTHIFSYSHIMRTDNSITFFVDFLDTNNKSNIGKATLSAIKIMKNIAHNNKASNLYVQWSPANKKLYNKALDNKKIFTYFGKAREPSGKNSYCEISDTGEYFFPVFKINTYIPYNKK